MRFVKVAFAVWAILASLAGWMPPEVEAAQIEVFPDPDGQVPVIWVEGELILGDEKQFAQVAIQHAQAIVAFNSPGGSAIAGIEIGKVIRIKGYWTFVPAQALCASACGYAWLGGIERYMERDSKIGFHAAFISENGESRESGAANALVGAYLNTLGLPEAAVLYVTQAAPDSMTWMSYETAASAGIAVQLADPPKASADIPPDGGALGAGQNLVTLQGADIFGYDLPGMPLRKISLSDCQRACASDQRCQAFTYNNKHSACFLKSSGERVFRNPQADAGYKAVLEPRLRLSEMGILEGTDIPGGDYSELKDVGFGACSDACEANDRCRAFTYHGKSKRCWLKSQASPPVSSKRMISGIKR